MDLYCSEIVSLSSVSDSSTPVAANNKKRRGSSRERPVRRAILDPVFQQNRVLNNLLKEEEQRVPVPTKTVQTEITQHMRRIVAEWMLEVCEERECQPEVFLYALNYMDRFLDTCCISKNQLQLLGSACLLIASKLRETFSKALNASLLVYYTDYSIEVIDLHTWEILVLSKLKWDMAVVTPNDFLSLIVSRLELRNLVEEEMVIRHAQTFVALAAKDYHFTMYSSSTMAAASIAAALQGLEWCKRAEVKIEDLLERLHQITKVEQDYLQTCLEQIEQMVRREIENNCHPNGRAGSGDDHGTTWTKQHNTPEKILSKAETPTDVRDIEF